MSLTTDDVAKIARLARIRLEEGEVAAMQQNLNGILALIDEMQAVNTEGVAPMAHAQDLALRLREDQVTEQNQREAFQAIAPNVEAGLYLVPKVIE